MADEALMREAELLSYAVLDRPVLEPLQRLVTVVAELMGVHMAEINAVTGEQTVHLATSDTHDGRVPVEHSFCSRTVLQDERIMVIEDAAQHPVFAGSPYVDGSLAKIAFYAGAKLVTPRGVSIGTLCVWHEAQMPFGDEQRKRLVDFADVVTSILEMRRDSTDTAEALRRLVDSHRRVSQSNESLEAFAGQVSHDLRTPLASLRLALSMLADTPGTRIDPIASELTTRAQAVLGRMQRSLNDLMDFALLGGSVPPEPVRISGVVREALEDLAAVSQHARIEVDEASLPVVLAHPSHVRAVVQNLVGNAAKYTGAAEADAVIRVDGCDGSTPQVGRVRVTDNGPGIPPELRESVFDLRVRGHHPSVEGHGIGLATCARMIESMGGAIGLEPAPGGGSRFWFELPLASKA